MKKNHLIISLIISLIMASNTVKADMLYDPIENEWELGSSNDVYMYNGFDNEWSYEPEGSQLEYNAFEHSWGYTFDGY